VTRAAPGGGGGTIVVDIDGIRRASGVLADGAQAYALVVGRLRGRALPEMPPGVAGLVSLEISEASLALAGEPQLLLDTAQELRVRAFWAQVADQLYAGRDLTGAQLTEFKAAFASGLLQRYAEPGQAELAAAYANRLHHREHPGGFAGFVHGAGDFFAGAWDSIEDPAVMLYHLTPLSDGWTGAWGDLGHGLASGVTHPLEFGKAIIDLDALQRRGVAYWLGNLAPAVAATLLSGGAAAAVRGGAAADRVVEGAAAADRLAAGASEAERVGVAARGLEEPVAASAALRSAFGEGHEWTYDLLHPGPLTPPDASLTELRGSAAGTFAGGKYAMVASDKPYVVFKAGEHEGGRFFTFEPPASEAQVRIDSAVKPVWTDAQGQYLDSSPLPRGYAFVVEHPEQAVAVGPVGTQGGVYLGGPDKLQLFIGDRAASGLRLVDQWPLNDPPAWVREVAGTP
jgi:filamentous hemagglutinin